MQEKYILEWKGKETKPLSLDEIKEMLDVGKLGLMYSVKTSSGGSIFLKDFLKSSPECVVEKEFKFNKNYLYALCGIGFLSLFGYVLILAMVAFVYIKGNKKLALNCFILGSVVSLLGYCFFYAIYPYLLNV